MIARNHGHLVCIACHGGLFAMNGLAGKSVFFPSTIRLPWSLSLFHPLLQYQGPLLLTVPEILTAVPDYSRLLNWSSRFPQCEHLFDLLYVWPLSISDPCFPLCGLFSTCSPVRWLCAQMPISVQVCVPVSLYACLTLHPQHRPSGILISPSFPDYNS